MQSKVTLTTILAAAITSLFILAAPCPAPAQLNPSLVGTYNTPGVAYDVHVSGDYAYVADSGQGLRIIDVSVPQTPTLVGFYGTSDVSYGIFVSGSYAYVADGYDGLRVLDVSNPTSPTLVGTYETNRAIHVHVSGAYAYVADYSSGLKIIDISNPASPTLTGSYDTYRARDVYSSGNYAYVADDTAGLLVFDVSNPASPSQIGTYNTAGSAFGVKVSGNYAYVADSGAGLQIIDVSNPASPTLTGNYNTPDESKGVFVSFGLAYVADDGAGLQIIDVSNPAAPFLTGSYDTTGYAIDVFVSANMVYVADDSAGLQVIDADLPDGDGDGMHDAWENAYSCVMANTVDDTADPDGDLLSNVSELAYDTDPCDPDTDDGGQIDGSEVIAGRDPLSPLDDFPDTDGDGLPDDWENTFDCMMANTVDDGMDHDSDTLINSVEYGLSTDPCSEGADGDGMDDGWEALHPCLDPLSADSLEDPDYDWLTNYQEYVRGTDPCVFNDADGDSMPDGWEETYACMQPSTVDDNLDYDVDYRINIDEYAASADPCVSEDTDGDGMPDGWELLYACLDADSADATLDPDADTLNNLQEYQALTDPCVQNDTDGDGMPDVWEAAYACMQPNTVDDGLDYDGDYFTNAVEYAASTNPCISEDTDGDGMPDGWELLYACLDADSADAALDPDADTLTNLQEYQAQTDPCVVNDADGDGMPDHWETAYPCMEPNTVDDGLDYDGDAFTNLTEYQNSTDPCADQDTDGDGMFDAWENLHACVDALTGDSLLDPDSDGIPNLAEYLAGADPCAAPPPIFFGPVDSFTGTSCGGYTRHLASGDFDEDGDIDIAGSYGGDCYTILTNRGQGKTFTAQNYSTDEELAYVIATQLPGDSTVDLLFVSNYQEIGIFTGAGNATFSRTGAVPFDPVIRMPALGDFNNDGIDDLAIIGSWMTDCNELRVYFGDASGAFGDFVSTDLPYEIDAYDVGNVDSDSTLDIVFMSDGVHTLLGDGAGGFGLSPYSLSVSGSDMALGMIDGDSILDLAVQSNGNISIYSGVGDGSFISISTILSFSNNELIVTDYNEDGRDDFFSVTGSSIRAVLSEGDTGYTDVQYIFYKYILEGPDMHIADLDGRYPLDVVVIDETHDIYFIFGVDLTQDTDGDGMPDGWEDLYFCVDSSVPDAAADPNGDGASNLVEYHNATDPCFDADADGDGMPNMWEALYACMQSATVDKDADFDGDYRTNYYEYTRSTNPCVAEDADGDGMPDGWEDLNNCTDTAIGDSLEDPDCDLMTNAQELAAQTDPCDAGTTVDPCSVLDSDGDGMTDGWEEQQAECGLDPLVGDSLGDPDSDGLTNMAEFLHNADACRMDGDGDGLIDLLEVSAYLTDPANPDSDGDGLSDAFEVGIVAGAGPNQALDSTPGGDDVVHDHAIWLGPDGVPGTTISGDDLEVSMADRRRFLTSPTVVDSDTDGVGDYKEAAFGSNPLDPGITPVWMILSDEVRITYDAQNYGGFDYDGHTDPHLVWTGSEFGLVHTGEIFKRVSPDGRVVKANMTIPDLDGWANALVWTGSEYGLIAGNGFKIFNGWGSVVDSFTVTDAEHVAWADDRFGFGGYDAAVTSMDGTPLSSAKRAGCITHDFGYGHGFNMSWTGSEFGVFYECRDETYFTRLSATGEFLSCHELGPHVASGASVNTLSSAWTGSEYGVVWKDEDYGPVYFTRFAGQGGKIGDAVRISGDGYYSGITWNGTEYGIISYHRRGDIFFDAVSGAGDTLFAETSIDGRVIETSSPIWTGSEYVIAWINYTDHEVYLSRFTRDSDGDGIKDSWEIGACTDSDDFDSDGDGTPDGADDADGDGVPDAYDPDNCAADADGDGMSDGWEYANGLDLSRDDARSDADGDGLSNMGEMGAGSDPNAADSDGDGMDDGYEVEHGLDPLAGDTASDPDGDGLSNLGEYNLGTSASDPDTDNDGLDDGVEAALGTDPLYLDSDGDGIADGPEVNLFLTSPLAGDTDTDGDGLPDLVETGSGSFTSWTDVGTDPADPDTDDDTVNDWSELRSGSNPFDAAITPNGGDISEPKLLIGEDTEIPYMGCEIYGNNSPSELVWTGSEYGLFFEILDNAFFTRITLGGDTIGVRSMSDDNGDFVDMAWNGYNYGVASIGDQFISALKLASDGSTVTGPYIFSRDESPSLAEIRWDGNRFGIFDSGWGNNFFTRHSLSVIEPGDGEPILFGSNGHFIDAVWTGSEYGIVVWHSDSVGNVFNRLDANGTVLDADTPCDGCDKIVWTGSEYGIAAICQDGQLCLKRVSADGQKIIQSGQLSNHGSSDLYVEDIIWTGSEFGIVYFEDDWGDFAIYFSRVSAAGDRVIKNIQTISDFSVFTENFKLSELAWTGNEYGFVFYDEQSCYIGPYFASFSADEDMDGDGLTVAEETAAGCLPDDWDTDDDGISDGAEVGGTHGTDPTLADTDGDGLSDGQEINTYSTDPTDPDTDDDGANDGIEVGLGLNPLNWDTDGDALPDGFEVDNSVGHGASGLDPLSAGDGLGADFDDDGIENSHEYWNGTDIWVVDVTGGASCFSWGDAGDLAAADGLVSPLDMTILKNRILGNSASYSGVLPPNGDSQKLMGDPAGVSPLDLSLIQAMISGNDTASNPTIPTDLVVDGDASRSVAEGATTRVTVSVVNSSAIGYSSSFGVVFEIDPSSTGSATLLGGEGPSGTGRYDVSGAMASGGLSSIVVRVDAPGTIYINATLPPCGDQSGKGRYCPEIEKAPAVTIVGY